MINVGILGTGFGSVHAEIYNRMEEFHLVSIFGRNETKLDELSQKYSVKTTSHIEEILTDESINLVDICLPSDLHRQYAIQALENGKHVFCETPVAFSVGDAEEIRRVSEETGQHVYVDLFTKFSSPHKLAINTVRQCDLGKPRYCYVYNKTPHIWGNLSVSKSIYNFFIHNMDFMLEIMGLPSTIDSFGLDMNERSTIAANYGFTGAMATVVCDSNLPDGFPFCSGYEIVCEEGSLKFDGMYGEDVSQKLLINRHSETRQVEYHNTNDYEEVIRHVKECLEDGRKSEYVDITQALNSLKIAASTYEKMRIITT